MNVIRSRFFLAALCVALALVIVPAVLASMGLGNVVADVVDTVTYPVRFCVSKIWDGFSGFTAYFTEYDRLKEENAALKETIRSYEDALHENEVLREENHWLRDYLSLKNEHIDYSLLDAAVIGRESTGFATVLTLSRGTAHGVAVGMPVVTDLGVFGYVKEVSYMSCKVVSIVETATAVGAFAERSGVTGLVEGDYTLRDDGKVLMKNIPVDADIVVGDRIYTSGTGSVYPRGLLVGNVEVLTPDPYSRTLTATIVPSEDFTQIHRISHLMIVTSYEVYTETESAEER